MGQKRSLWALMAQPSSKASCPKVRAVYFDKRDAEKRIQWLKSTSGGHRHDYWIAKTPFIESAREVHPSTHESHRVLCQE